MLSARLGAVIAGLGVKKGEFADKTGFSQAYISMMLSGKKTNPSARFYESVAREYGISAAWLRDGTGPMHASAPPDITDDDAWLLAKYRLLPIAERRVVDEVINAMLVKSKAAQKAGPQS